MPPLKAAILSLAISFLTSIDFMSSSSSFSMDREKCTRDYMEDINL